jgi:hypothetical protein
MNSTPTNQEVLEEIKRRKEMFWDVRQKCWRALQDGEYRRVTRKQIDAYIESVKLEMTLPLIAQLPGNSLEERNGWRYFHFVDEGKERTIARRMPLIDCVSKGIVPDLLPSSPGDFLKN